MPDLKFCADQHSTGEVVFCTPTNRSILGLKVPAYYHARRRWHRQFSQAALWRATGLKGSKDCSVSFGRTAEA